MPSASLFPRRHEPSILLDSMISGLMAERIVFVRYPNHYFLDARRLKECGVQLLDLCARKASADALRLVKQVMSHKE